MIADIFKASDIVDISDQLMMENGKIKLLPAAEYKKFRWEDFRTFCHFKGRYGVPTVELIDYLIGVIDGRSALEIGSGAGDLGYHLGIKMTDSKIQEDPLVAKSYEAMRQPVIKYPEDVEKIESFDAVIKYKPQVVLASWITPHSPKETSFGSNPFGIKESKILDLVETFIIIGNLDTHWDKPIRKIEHHTFYFDWLVSRGKNQENNRIFIWDK